jgi:hypothetical protein
MQGPHQATSPWQASSWVRPRFKRLLVFQLGTAGARLPLHGEADWNILGSPLATRGSTGGRVSRWGRSCAPGVGAFPDTRPGPAASHTGPAQEERECFLLCGNDRESSRVGARTRWGGSEGWLLRYLHAGLEMGVCRGLAHSKVHFPAGWCPSVGASPPAGLLGGPAEYDCPGGLFRPPQSCSDTLFHPSPPSSPPPCQGTVRQLWVLNLSSIAPCS